MMPAERLTAFKKIKAFYDKRDREGLAKGRLPMHTTEYGFWGTTNMNDAYMLFTRINLDEEEAFIDLGAGDGRIVAIASLFTAAVGIEGNEELAAIAASAKEALGLPMEVRHSDYREENLSPYPVIFMFPDKEFDTMLTGKFLSECAGKLYIYNDIYKPAGLPRTKTIWIEQLPVATYDFSRR